MIDEARLIEDIHAYFRKKIDADATEIIDHDILTFNKEICEIVKKQPKVNEWVPCSERLPEIGQMVLSTENEDVIFCTYEYFYGYGCGFYPSYGNVTAWMSLPPAYQPK